MPISTSWNRNSSEGGFGEVDLGERENGFGDSSKLLAKHENLSADSLQNHATEVALGLDGFQDGAPDAKAIVVPKYIILPDTTFRRVWMRIMLVVALYIIWVTPIHVGFHMVAVGGWFWMEGIINIFFWADLGLNFITAFEHPVTSELIMDHKKIAIRYLKTWFVIDLLSTFPSDYIVRGIEGTWACSFKGDCSNVVAHDQNVKLIMLLRTLRIFRFVWIFKNFNILSLGTVLGRLQDDLFHLRWVLTVFELLIFLIYMGHLTGCFFYFFSGPSWRTSEERILMDAGELSSWTQDKLGGYDMTLIPTRYFNASDRGGGMGDIFNPSLSHAQDLKSKWWYQCPEFYTIGQCPECKATPHLRCHTNFGFAYRYVTSMYWGYTTMTTVGYGDIYGTTIAEKLWCMITMVIGGFFLSFCFGKMASVVARLDADTAVRGDQLHELTQFMKDVELPRLLSKKVLNYFKKQKVKAYDRQRVLGRLPFELRAKILRHLYDPVLRKVPLLSSLGADEVLFADLCIRLLPAHYSAETFVWLRGELGGDLFILLQGELQVLDVDKKTVMYTLPQHSLFGESALLRGVQGQTKAKRTDNVYCKGACDMLRIPEEDAKDLVEHHPELLNGLMALEKVRGQRSRALRKPEAAAAPASLQSGSSSVAPSKTVSFSGGGPDESERLLQPYQEDVTNKNTLLSSLGLGPRVGGASDGEGAPLLSHSNREEPSAVAPQSVEGR